MPVVRSARAGSAPPVRNKTWTMSRGFKSRSRPSVTSVRICRSFLPVGGHLRKALAEWRLSRFTVLRLFGILGEL